jgi:hypothetical protein
MIYYLFCKTDEADEYDNDYCDDPILEIPMQTLDDGRLRVKMAIARY